MKISFLWLGLFVALTVNAGDQVVPASDVTHAPACIELKDQFDSPRKLSFPATNLTVLTIADHKGSEQVAGWVAPVKARYGLRVAIHGIADVSAVPGWLRGVVRKKFQQRQTYPVLLDWSGETVKAFASVHNCVNGFVLDEHGRILKRFLGEATPGTLAELYGTIDQALSRNQPPGATQ